MKSKFFHCILFFAALSASAGFFDQLKDNAQNQANEAASSAIDEGTKQQLAEASQIKSLLSSAVDTSKQLESMLGENPELKALVSNSAKSLLQSQDFVALQDINTLTAAKLTPEQMTLAQSLRSDVEVLALKRNLPSSGPVTSAANAIQSGDYNTAVTQLQQTLQSGSLNDSQKQLISTIIGAHPITAE